VDQNRIAGVKAQDRYRLLAVGFDVPGVRRHHHHRSPALQIPHNDTLDKTYLFLIVMASALLSFWVARLTACRCAA
jgi:hypothetical protein